MRASSFHRQPTNPPNRMLFENASVLGCIPSSGAAQHTHMTAALPLKTAAELLGITDAPRNARDRLIDKAIDLFYRHGFNAIGLDRIIDEVGVTKTTFYKYFQSKDDLMVAAVRKRDEWEGKAWGRAVRQAAGDDPRAQLLAIYDVMDTWFNAPDFRGCLFLNTAAEFPNPHDPVHQAAAAHKRRMRDHFRDLAGAAGAARAAAETFADCFTALVEGALILRQTHGRNDAARVVRPAVEQLVGTYLPGVAETAGAGNRRSGDA